MKIILDTNVLIAAFLTHGQCAELLEYCIFHHSLITSDFILKEFRDNMRVKFKFGAGDVKEALELLAGGMDVVEPVLFDAQICRDKDDDAVLGTAAALHADCIVTGDKDLLDLVRFRETDIIKPNKFWAYEQKRGTKD